MGESIDGHLFQKEYLGKSVNSSLSVNPEKYS